jgi:hypothetical protein
MILCTRPRCAVGNLVDDVDHGRVRQLGELIDVVFTCDARCDREPTLPQHRAVVLPWGKLVHGESPFFGPVSEHPKQRRWAAVERKQRRVQVDAAMGRGRDHARRQQLVEERDHQQLHLCPLDHVDDLGLTDVSDDESWDVGARCDGKRIDLEILFALSASAQAEQTSHRDIKARMAAENRFPSNRQRTCGSHHEAHIVARCQQCLERSHREGALHAEKANTHEIGLVLSLRHRQPRAQTPDRSSSRSAQSAEASPSWFLFEVLIEVFIEVFIEV